MAKELDPKIKEVMDEMTHELVANLIIELATKQVPLGALPFTAMAIMLSSYNLMTMQAPLKFQIKALELFEGNLKLLREKIIEAPAGKAN